jgi:hypothetical protein
MASFGTNEVEGTAEAAEESSELLDRNRSRPPWSRRRWLVTILCTGAVSAILGRVLPPFEIDGTWWGTFFTSAGFGGAAAVGAATIALSAAVYTSNRAANNAAQDRDQRALAEQRSQWWDRFIWATERAVNPATSIVGVKVLSTLAGPDIATLEDAKIAIEVTEVIDPEPRLESDTEAGA